MEHEERQAEEPQAPLNAEAPPDEEEPPTDSTEAAPEEAAPTEADALEEAMRERDQFRAMAQRAQADFVNYKRRTEEVRQELVRNAASLVILQLLPIVDDLKRSLEHLPAEAPDSWTAGIQMILRKLQALLEAEGVTSFEPEVGLPLDPAEHDAVFYEPTDEHPPGAIVRVILPGYRTRERLLRPAQVTVAQDKTEEAK